MTTPETPRKRRGGGLGFFFIIGLSFEAGVLVTAGFRFRPLDSDHMFLVVVGCASLGAAIFLALQFVGILRELGMTNKLMAEAKSFSR
jgi:hypothetical protein